jgi:hypothetical protein
MTKHDETIARQLLGTLAQVTDLFRNNAVSVGRHNKVSKTVNAVEFIRSTTGPMLTGYLDAELKDGTALSWLLDVVWSDESWTICARLARTTRNGPETIQMLPTEEIREFDHFRDSLLRIVQQLLALRSPALD